MDVGDVAAGSAAAGVAADVFVAAGGACDGGAVAICRCCRVSSPLTNVVSECEGTGSG